MNSGRYATALTDRELQLLRLLWEAPDSTAVDVAGVLDLTPGTVRNHLASINAKLGTFTRLAAVKVALERGLLAMEPHAHTVVHVCRECGVELAPA